MTDQYDEFGEPIDDAGLLTELEDFPIPEDPILEDPTGESYDPIDGSFLLPKTIADTSYKGLVGTSVKLKKNFVLNGTLKSDATVTTVAGNAAETTLNSYVFDINELHVGATIRIWAAGIYTTDDATANVAIKFKVGSTTYHTVTTTGATVTNVPWCASWTVIISQVGSSGTAESFVTAKTNNVNKDSGSTATQTFDTTAQNTFAITATWASGDAADSISIRQMIVEILN